MVGRYAHYGQTKPCSARATAVAAGRQAHRATVAQRRRAGRQGGESYQHLGHCVTGFLHLEEFAVERSSMRGISPWGLNGGAFLTRQSRSLGICYAGRCATEYGDQYFQKN